MWVYWFVQWHQVCLLNCTWIRWCIIETSSGLPRKSSAIFGNLRTSSEIFGNSRKVFGNVRLVFGTILENLRKSSEGVRKSSENYQKRRHQHVYIIKRTLHGGLKIWILFSRAKTIFYSLAALVRKILFCHSKIKFISSCHCVISSISFTPFTPTKHV